MERTQLEGEPHLFLECPFSPPKGPFMPPKGPITPLKGTVSPPEGHLRRQRSPIKPPSSSTPPKRPSTVLDSLRSSFGPLRPRALMSYEKGTGPCATCLCAPWDKSLVILCRRSLDRLLGLKELQGTRLIGACACTPPVLGAT